MENWKERFRNQFVDTYGEKNSKEWRIAYQPIEELEDFISQELDKAREEGYKAMLEGLDNIARDSSGGFYKGVAIIKLRNEIARLYKLSNKRE